MLSMEQVLDSDREIISLLPLIVHGREALHAAVQMNIHSFAFTR